VAETSGGAADEVARDEQDLAEALDTDKLDDDIDGAVGEADDPTGALEYPPERPLGVNQYGVTAAEERVGEPREERERRDTRDPLDALAEPDEEELRRIERELEEGDLDAYDGADDATDDGTEDGVDDDTARGASVGRLVDPGADDDAFDLQDDEPDAVARRADEHEHDLSAEEDAVHLAPDPPFGRLGDGYVRGDDLDDTDLDDTDLDDTDLDDTDLDDTEDDA
jgi:hypothetical protein